jgi:pimeloyl-ACP methyl ester carboxylesterase
MPPLRRLWLPLLLLLLLGAALFFTYSDASFVWPVRNTLFYQAGCMLEGRQLAATPTPQVVGGETADATTGARTCAGLPAPRPDAPRGELAGCVADAQGRALPGATVLVAAPDGTTFSALGDARGCYRIAGVPEGRYVPVAGAPGHDDTRLGAVRVAAGQTYKLDIMMLPVSLPDVSPGRDLRISAPVTRTWDLPVPSTALSRTVTFDSGGRPNQPTLLFTPVTTTARLPLLIAVYPGPAPTWDAVSIPLASAGYAVLAVGPAYALDLEPDIAELQRLIAFARAGRLPGVDGSRIALLGGSYSGLHVLRYLERDIDFDCVVLLGPPSDLFDMRRRFEDGSFFPPYGLDQALIALGTPDKSPERYWRYSAAYHLRGDTPPLLLLHSKQDEVIPYQQSELLARALDRVGAPYEMHVFDGMKHYLLATEASPELSELYRLTLGFLDRNLD